MKSAEECGKHLEGRSKMEGINYAEIVEEIQKEARNTALDLTADTLILTANGCRKSHPDHNISYDQLEELAEAIKALKGSE